MELLLILPITSLTILWNLVHWDNLINAMEFNLRLLYIHKLENWHDWDTSIACLTARLQKSGDNTPSWEHPQTIHFGISAYREIPIWHISKHQINWSRTLCIYIRRTSLFRSRDKFLMKPFDTIPDTHLCPHPSERFHTNLSKQSICGCCVRCYRWAISQQLSDHQRQSTSLPNSAVDGHVRWNNFGLGRIP